MSLAMTQLVDRKVKEPFQEGLGVRYRREYLKNFRYFHRNYKTLMEKHPNEHVAICDRDIFDHNKDLEKLIKKVSENRNIRKCFIGFVSSPETELIL